MKEQYKALRTEEGRGQVFKPIIIDSSRPCPLDFLKLTITPSRASLHPVQAQLH
jgi:hypothetical protein